MDEADRQAEQSKLCEACARLDEKPLKPRRNEIFRWLGERDVAAQECPHEQREANSALYTHEMWEQPRIGLASFLNAKLVQRFGMEAMARAAFMGLASVDLSMLLASMLWSGRLPLFALMAFGFSAFFAIGILFGNLNAMAMRSLGQVAGLGASLIASGSSLIATLYAIGIGRFYDGTAVNLAAGFFVAGASSLILAELAIRGDASPVEAAQ